MGALYLLYYIYIYGIIIIIIFGQEQELFF